MLLSLSLRIHMYSRNMGGVPNPWNAMESIPPPSPSSSPTNSNLTMLYYGLVVVGAAALLLAIYNLVVIRWCTRQHLVLQPSRINQFSAGMRRRGLKNSDMHLLSTFRYKKEVGIQAKEEEEEEEAVHKVEYECSVCLSVFEEDEEVKILPRCNHSFHAACIDMWLYSHFDCPLCRQPVRPLCHQLLQVNANSTQSSQSQDV